MVRYHGSQCGFCTPGFVVAMHGLCEQAFSPDSTVNGAKGETKRLDEATLRQGLSGNLCRCTGYVQIIEAGKSVDAADVVRMNELYPPREMLDHFSEVHDQSLSVSCDDQIVLLPRTFAEAVELKSVHPEARIVSGATDVGVWYNHGRPSATV